jgi:hypothetical protein
MIGGQQQIDRQHLGHEFDGRAASAETVRPRGPAGGLKRYWNTQNKNQDGLSDICHGAVSLFAVS